MQIATCEVNNRIRSLLYEGSSVSSAKSADAVLSLFLCRMFRRVGRVSAAGTAGIHQDAEQHLGMSTRLIDEPPGKGLSYFFASQEFARSYPFCS